MATPTFLAYSSQNFTVGTELPLSSPPDPSGNQGSTFRSIAVWPIGEVIQLFDATYMLCVLGAMVKLGLPDDLHWQDMCMS